MKNLKLTALIFFLITAVSAGYFLSRNNKNSNSQNPQLSLTRTVIFTKEGFSPQQLVIKPGESVTFKTQSGLEFWPASDPHPTHQIYPEFDAKKIINSSSPWSFTFERSGNWSYHDHLNPLHRGEIIVLDAKGKEVFSLDCGRSENKAACWQDDIKNILQQKGLSAAFDEMASLYSSEPAFAANCHGFTHTLGQAAYYEFKKGNPVELSIKTSYCGYGFYHGFMETLLHESGNLQEARDFCSYAQKTLTGVTGKPMIACYHGIGHGAVDGGDPSAWGNTRAIISPALLLCEKVGADDNQKYLCASGVFNALAIAYNNSMYKLAGDSNDPYIDCISQSQEYFKKACYEEMNTRALLLAHGNFAGAINFVKKIQNPIFAAVALENLASAASMNAPEQKFKGLAQACQTVSAEFVKLCFEGMAGGLLEGGRPGLEYLSAIDFCSQDLLTVKQSEVCFKRVISSVKFLYPENKLPEICKNVPEKFIEQCLN